MPSGTLPAGPATRKMLGMRSRAGAAVGVVVLAVAAALAAWSAVPSSAATPTPSPSPVASPGSPSSGLGAAGHATGELAKDRVVTVTVSAHDDGGWQAITDVDILLSLRGRTLDQVTLDPAHVTITVIGTAQPQPAGLGGTLRGPYFEVNTSSVGLSAKSENFRAVVPIRLLADPPSGARLLLSVTNASLDTVGPMPLGPPVVPDQGLTWSTLLLAVLIALVAGGLVGNLFSSRRRRPERLSVYRAVEQRMAGTTAAPHDREPEGGHR